MKLSDLKQKIEELDAKVKGSSGETLTERVRASSDIEGKFVVHGPELLRRLLVAEYALANWNRVYRETDCEYDDCNAAAQMTDAALKTIRGEEE